MEAARRFRNVIFASLGFVVLLTTALLNLEEITGWITDDAGEMGSVKMGTERAEELVLFEQTREQMRARNRVREMWELEEQQESSRIVGVYGFEGYVYVKQALDRWRTGCDFERFLCTTCPRTVVLRRSRVARGGRWAGHCSALRLRR